MSDEGQNPEPQQKVAPILIIEMTPEGLKVRGNVFGNGIIAFGMLEAAKDVIRANHEAKMKSRIEIATMVPPSGFSL